MPPDGSQPEEAPSRINREKLPGRAREGHASHDRNGHPRDPTAASYRPGVRADNEHSGAKLTLTTASLTGDQNGGYSHVCCDER
jgi:hypothetical protein